MSLSGKYSISNTLSSGLTQRQQSSPAPAIVLPVCVCFWSLTLAREQRLNFYLYNKLNKKGPSNECFEASYACLHIPNRSRSWLSKDICPFWIFFRLDVIAIFKYGTTELSKSLPGKNGKISHWYIFFFFFSALPPPHNSSCFNSGLSSTVFLY